MDLRRDCCILLLSFLICILEGVSSSASDSDNVTFSMGFVHVPALTNVMYCDETCDMTEKKCRCDDECLKYGDCCKEKYYNFTDTEISERATPTESCTDVSGLSYFILRNCSLSWNDDNWRNLCEFDDGIQDILLDLPVYDPEGNHYKNMACAFCNYIPLQNLLTWDILKHDLLIPIEYEDSEINSLSTYVYTPPGHLAPRTCDSRFVNNECTSDSCPDYYSPVTFQASSEYYHYKNPDCASCNGFDFNYESMCTTVGIIVGDGDGNPDPGIQTLIIAMVPIASYEELEPYTCDDGEVFDPDRQTCIKLLCQEGFILVDDQCVRLTATCPLWILQFNVSYYSDRMTNVNDTLVCLLPAVLTNTELSQITSYSSVTNGDLQQIQFEIQSILDYSSLSSYLLFTSANKEPSLCNVTSLQVDQFCLNKPDNCSRNGIETFTSTNVGNQTMIFVNKSQAIISPDESLFRYKYTDLEDGSFNSTSQLFVCSQDNVEGLSCPFILDDRNAYEIVNGTLEHIESGRIYGPKNYELDGNQTVRICSTFKQTGTLTTIYHFVEYNEIQTLLSTIGCVFSIIALAVTFIVYCLFPSLRTLPGKSVMSLTVALFCAQCLLTFGAGQTDNTNLCKVIAVAMHFFWLASFFWMSVLAYDISKTFNNTYNRSKDDTTRKTFAKYSTVAWGLSCTIVALCLALSMEVESLGFEYGSTSVCWISDPIVSLVIFGGPVILTLCVNVVFFGLTVHGVRGTMKTSSILKRSSSKMTQTVIELKIYLKITSLMGFSWIFGFIATFTDVDVLWYLFIILGSLQGVFIFFSFVCNARVFTLLIEKFDINLWRVQRSTVTTSSRVTSA